MNKTELIDKIAAGAEITKAQAKAALEATTNALKEALIAGDKIQLVGFGTFSINERPAREGINPATKEKIRLQLKRLLSSRLVLSLQMQSTNNCKDYFNYKYRAVLYGCPIFFYSIQVYSNLNLHV